MRTPLNAILGFAQLLEAGSPPPTATQTARLHQIIKAGWYLLDLINEILDLAVIESGKLSLSRVPVALIDVMRECQAMVEPQAQKHNIQVDFLHSTTPGLSAPIEPGSSRFLIKPAFQCDQIQPRAWHGRSEVHQHPGKHTHLHQGQRCGIAPEKLEQLFSRSIVSAGCWQRRRDGIAWWSPSDWSN